MLNRLRNNRDIVGVEIKKKTYKLAAFADDVLFLPNPLKTIPNLLKDFSLFNLLSNLKINFTKSTALNISLPDATVSLCKTNFPFHWEEDSLTYLGIKLTPNLKDLYSKNFLPLLKNIKSDLLSWDKGFFSWFGRADIIKMNILPRILYLLQTIPIKIPSSFFKDFKRMCTKFIWNLKQPRIKWDKLIIPKLLGGTGLPDVQKYYWACHLTRILDWHLHAHTKAWVELEEVSSSPALPLIHLPWITARKIPPVTCSHPFIGATLQIFRTLCKNFHFSSVYGPLTPINFNPESSPKYSIINASDSTCFNSIRAESFFEKGNLLTLDSFQLSNPGVIIPPPEYEMIKRFL